MSEEKLATELGRQRIEELRAIAIQTPPNRVILPGGESLMLPRVNEPYVMLPSRELLALLDRVDAAELDREGVAG